MLVDLIKKIQKEIDGSIGIPSVGTVGGGKFDENTSVEYGIEGRFEVSKEKDGRITIMLYAGVRVFVPSRDATTISYPPNRCVTKDDFGKKITRKTLRLARRYVREAQAQGKNYGLREPPTPGEFHIILTGLEKDLADELKAIRTRCKQQQRYNIPGLQPKIQYGS